VSYRKKQKAVLTVIAILVGATLGSFDQLSRFVTEPKSQRHSVDDGSDRQEAHRISGDQVHVDAPTATANTPMANPSTSNMIFLPGDVTMTPHRVNGMFIGYEVVSAGSDDRFSTGDVITSLNGAPVEDSAAGGELMIAALADRNSKIEFHSQ
jgi:hypothetical protein